MAGGRAGIHAAFIDKAAQEKAQRICTGRRLRRPRKSPPHRSKPGTMSSSWPEGRSAERIADGLALSILGAVAIIAALTFRDYGLGWDDYTHAEYGGLLLHLYSSGFSDQRALSFVNLYAYGGGFDMLSALAAKVLPFDLFETRRLVGAIVGLIGIFITWRLARRVGGPLAALIAVALLATCPLYYGNMFMNAKDSPFAVAMVFLTLALVRAFEEYPRPSPITCAMVGIGAGLAIGTRVLGGLAAINALAALAPGRSRWRRAATACAEAGARSRRLRRPLRAGTPARLCRDGAGVAVVGHRAAQPAAGGGILLPFLREAVEGDVRRNGGAGAGDAAPIRAADFPAQGAGNLSRAWNRRNRRRAGGGDAPRRRDLAARDLSAARLCRRVPDRAGGADQARHVQRHPPFRVRGAGARGAGRARRCLDRRRAVAAVAASAPDWRSRCSWSACSCRSRRW